MKRLFLDLQSGLMQIIGCQLKKIALECFLFTRIDLNKVSECLDIGRSIGW